MVNVHTGKQNDHVFGLPTNKSHLLPLSITVGFLFKTNKQTIKPPNQTKSIQLFNTLISKQAIKLFVVYVYHLCTYHLFLFISFI